MQQQKTRASRPIPNSGSLLWKLEGPEERQKRNSTHEVLERRARRVAVDDDDVVAEYPRIGLLAATNVLQVEGRGHALAIERAKDHDTARIRIGRHAPRQRDR